MEFAAGAAPSCCRGSPALFGHPRHPTTSSPRSPPQRPKTLLNRARSPHSPRLTLVHAIPTRVQAHQPKPRTHLAPALDMQALGSRYGAHRASGLIDAFRFTWGACCSAVLRRFARLAPTINCNSPCCWCRVAKGPSLAQSTPLTVPAPLPKIVRRDVVSGGCIIVPQYTRLGPKNLS